MTTATRTYTIAEFMALPDTRNGRLVELVNGELQEKAMPGMRHNRIGRLILRRLDAYAIQHDLGEVFGDGSDFIIDPSPTRPTVRTPDVAFLTKGRITRDMLDTDAPFPVPPDLTVEIWSPHDYDHPRERQEKIRQFQAAGVPLVWAIDPRNQQVRIYHPADPEPQTLGTDDTVSGESVIPGFTLAVRDLFAPES